MKKKPEADFVIFDLGNVIVDIFYTETLDYIKQKVAPIHHERVASFYLTDFHKDYEKGLISSDEFRQEIKNYFEEDWSDEFVDHLWNYLLGKIPVERLELAKNLKEHYRTGVLSNTNEIHIQALNKILKEDHGLESLHDLFEHVYFSHEMNLSKPDPLIYKALVEDLNTTPEKVIFFDDLKANVESAREIGIQAHQVTGPNVIFDFFKHV
ncbi:HAD family hydrolase [Algoriphagus sediminis]|uniref:HAD family phosphatase n=1 Tax=Algoriphagus sediminis TaxID=3057113 RepID=A0ABT7YA80_9BACT|nr:HAD family phosphatase [Algoriphagus sediminis]MDN3203351.1 HAD family phosphatase [Algoriphagus sediminis]